MRITLNADDHAAPESDSDPVMTKLDGVGASKNELFDEVLRQQNGVRGKMVTLLTTVKNSHCHRVHIDRMGDGVTESDDSRHSHRVMRFKVLPAKDHDHELTVGVP